MTPRYAIYYVPDANNPLFKLGTSWLGRDAYTGNDVERDLEGADGVDLDMVTRGPRHYGFHATLKAPFELAEGTSEADLIAAGKSFGEKRAAFDVDLSVQALGKFIALRLVNPSPEMQSLHEDCVRDFDQFREDITEFDLARRRKSNLTDTQDERLVKWGYPYIFDEFRFHMTLTGGIADAGLRSKLVQALQLHFPPQQHRVDGVGIYKQDDRDAPFYVLERVCFSR